MGRKKKAGRIRSIRFAARFLDEYVSHRRPINGVAYPGLTREHFVAEMMSGRSVLCGVQFDPDWTAIKGRVRALARVLGALAR